MTRAAVSTPTAVTPRLVGGLAVVVLTSYGLLYQLAQGRPGWTFLPAFAIFAGVSAVCRDHASRAPMWFLLLATLTVQLPGLLIGPITSDDAWRYVWDGRVQLAGIDPCRYAPLDPALAFLRDAVLFPPDGGTHINRPTVPTLYPPVGQLWFTFWSWVTPWSWGTLGVQLGAVLTVLVTTGLLARFLGRNRSWALLYGACPAVAVEAASAAHLDAVAALCLLGFGWSAARARHWWAGLFLGLAAGLKLVPLLLIPALLRRGRWRTSLTAVTVVIGGYLPHVLAVGALVWGYLPGYWQEEGYQGDARFALLGWLPPTLRTGAALAIAAGLAVLALVRSGREPVLVTCCWLYGAAFLVATPTYPWYALGYVVLVLMAGRLEWLAIWPAMYASAAFYAEPWAKALPYALALAVVVTVSRTSRRRRSPAATGAGDHETTAAVRPAPPG